MSNTRGTLGVASHLIGYDQQHTRLKAKSEASERVSPPNDDTHQLITLFKEFLMTTKQAGPRQWEGDLEPRDRQVRVQLPVRLGGQGLERYLTELCKVVWSRAFHYLSTGQVSYEYAKIYSSEQILQNLVRLSEVMQLRAQHFEVINRHMGAVLEYMLNKYPLTLSQDINRNVNASIRQVDNSDQLSNDYLTASPLPWRYRQNGQYNDLIMLTLNQVLTKIETKVRGKTIYEKFEEKMERLFEAVTDEEWMKEQERKDKEREKEKERERKERERGKEGESSKETCRERSRTGRGREKERQKSREKDQFYQIEELDSAPRLSPFSLAGGLPRQAHLQQTQLRRQLLKQKQKDKQKYRLKVKQYTSYKISRKLPESTRPFTEEQILSRNIKIQSPQVLRLLTKWCEELERKFSSPNYYEHHIETLKLQDGKIATLVLDEMKENLDLLIAEERAKISGEIAELAQNNYSLQSQLLMRELMARGSPEIEKYERIAAGYSVGIVNNLHAYILAYLNRLIHGLLAVGQRFAKLPVVGHCDWSSSVNLVTFQVSDLLRCRCSSGEKEIMRIYSELLKTCESPNMHLVKVVNRLRKGTHDILINVRYREVLCEVQLAVTNPSNKFIEYSNLFNHYLYELKRSVFGPLTELSSIWKCLDSRFTLYRPSAPSPAPSPHCCRPDCSYEAYTRPFICSGCCAHYSHNNFIKQHLKCKHCAFWLCARCQLETSECQSLLTAAFRNLEIIKKCARHKPAAPLPDYGICIFIESQEIKVEPFHKYTAKNGVKVIGIKHRALYEICDATTPAQEAAFRQQFLIFELPETFGRKHIKIDEERIREFLNEQKLRAVYRKNKEKVSLNYAALNCDRLKKLTALGALEQKMAIRKVELIGNRLESVAAIAEEFRNLHTLEISKNSVDNFEGIERLARLEKLYANENKMKEFPKELCALENLRELSLCENELKSVPAEIVRLRKLKSLKLGSNRLEEFPASLGGMISELSLKSNFIKHVPNCISSLSHLEVLELQNNYIGSIHEAIGQLTQLAHLNLNHNQLTSLPPTFAALAALTRCSLRNNKLAELPPAVAQLPALTYLDLCNNELKQIPVLCLPHLCQLNLNNNQLTKLPDFGQQCTALRVLTITHNQLQELPSLKYLHLLQELHINNNQLTLLHESVTGLERLELLNAEENKLEQIAQLKLEQLKTLSLSNNHLQAFTNCDLRRLEELDLRCNELAVFADNVLPALNQLNLTNNKLTHLDLANFPRLRTVQAAHNLLQTLPQVPQRSRLKTLQLNHNCIRRLPSSPGLTKLRSLSIINLAHNQIGLVPRDLLLLAGLRDNSLQLYRNPIEKVECWDFLLRKGTHSTLQHLEVVRSGSKLRISEGELDNSYSHRSASDLSQRKHSACGQ